MTNRPSIYIACLIIAVLSFSYVHAQVPRNLPPGVPPIRPRTDTTAEKLEHRNPLEDSITISYHYFDSTRPHKLDSSISDFFARFPVPFSYADLGNFGNAVRSFLFTPYMKPGWDAGFHSYDIYNFTVENTRLFTTTRPYTELAYFFGSKSEQLINLMHTQTRNKGRVNVGFEYRQISSPSAYKNQNTSHHNIRVNVSYQGVYKRYAASLIFINNKLHSAENGGIQNDSDLTKLTFNDPFGIPTRIGNASSFSRNFFTANVGTGTIYDQNIIMFRHTYDLGQKDSLVADTVTYRLFYPRIRFQHTLEYRKENYVFQDQFPDDSLYLKYYSFLPNSNTVYFKDSWEKLTNDFSIISFPQKNNLNQFLKANAGFEWISGGYYPYKNNYTNIYFGGEYRNRTRNQKWDLVASGRFYTAGDYAGDYETYISLERLLGKKGGDLLVGFQNVNRSPASIFDKSVSSFPVITDGNFNKENISRFFANINFSALGLSLSGDYYFIGNYMYFDNFFSARQQSAIFNVLHAGAEKKIRLKRLWYWYIDAHIQQATGNAPVNLPFLFTLNRFAFEGNFFKNLFLSTGFEVRYYTGFNADNYSPFNGQFFLQSEFNTRGNRPDLSAYLNFRIKSFKGFIRVENLNTINLDNNYKFTRNNFSGPHYPQKSFWFRAGIWWSFVN
jgi:hypothetical protein